MAGIKGLPSVFNIVITLAVLSVANSCAFGSTRTMQALAAQGMGPKFLAYVDKRGRPLWCVILQLVFGLLAFANEAKDSGPTFFYWLLALSGLANFFIWGSICICHIRFRKAWRYNGRTLDELPYQAAFGVWGSWAGLFIACLCLVASFYTALYPVGGSPDPTAFFQSYLAAPMMIAFYIFWKLWSRDWRLLIPIEEMDINTGMRADLQYLREEAEAARIPKTWANLPLRIVRGLF